MLSTWFASTHRPAGALPLISPTQLSTTTRHRPLRLFGESPDLSDEEYKALAGIYRVYLDLEDRGMALSLHLEAPKVEERDEDDVYNPWAPGRILPMEEVLCYGCFNVMQGDKDGWKSARWSVRRDVHAGEEGDDKLTISLKIGNLRLQGRGRRIGFRCPAWIGTIIESGITDTVPPSPYARTVGLFCMGLLLPIKTDAGPLEEKYQQRIAERKPFAGDVGSLLEEYADEDELMKDLTEACDEGMEEACDIVSREEEAKKAWLERLNAPLGAKGGGDDAKELMENDKDATRDAAPDVY